MAFFETIILNPVIELQWGLISRRPFHISENVPLADVNIFFNNGLKISSITRLSEMQRMRIQGAFAQPPFSF